MMKLKQIFVTMAALSMLMPSAALAIHLGDGVAHPIAGGELLPGTVGTELGTNPNADIRVTIARIIRVAMGLLGIVAVVIVLIGGFKWMTAGGNEEQTGEAKQWIFSGVIGLAIILSAYALTNFIISNLVSATR